MTASTAVTKPALKTNESNVGDVSSKTLVQLDTFIRVPPQLIVPFGAQGRRSWYLDLENVGTGDAALLIMTQPDCPFCDALCLVLKETQQKAYALHKKTIQVYLMGLGPHVVRSQTLARNMNVRGSPALFVCKTSTGRLIPWDTAAAASNDGDEPVPSTQRLTTDVLMKVLNIK